MPQEIRIFARLPDGSLRVAKREHGSPAWQWPVATGIVGPSSFNGDVVLTIADIADLPTGPGQIGVV